jgi:hypothetical protein
MKVFIFYVYLLFIDIKVTKKVKGNYKQNSK